MNQKHNIYLKLLNKIFFDRYKDGVTVIDFSRDDLVRVANELGVDTPKNLGDVVYSHRYRIESEEIKAKSPPNKSWAIFGTGKARYQFKLVSQFRLVPREGLIVTKILDATPEIIKAYSLSDEQSLLAKVRYNRLIDTFLGVTAYSLQNHLRTSVPQIGQIEIDEVYVAVDKFGAQYIIPVQAKRGNDKSSIVQTYQDIKWCKKAFPQLIPVPISVQFIDNHRIAIFSLKEINNDIVIDSERHYLLVKKDGITVDELKSYANSSILS